MWPWLLLLRFSFAQRRLRVGDVHVPLRTSNHVAHIKATQHDVLDDFAVGHFICVSRHVEESYRPKVYVSRRTRRTDPMLHEY